jgi:hypothetical protein
MNCTVLRSQGSQAVLVICRTLRWNGENVNTKQRLRLPQPNSGHHDALVELAATLSAEVDARQATTIDLTTKAYDAGSTILPTRRQSHRGWRVGGGIVLALAAAVVALLATIVMHQANPAPAKLQAPVSAALPAAPTTPAAWGRAARARLSAGGRPVSAFGCMGAYDIDAPGSSGILPIAYQGTPEYTEYLSACVSDMSGQAVAPNEVAR